MPKNGPWDGWECLSLETSPLQAEPCTKICQRSQGHQQATPPLQSRNAGVGHWQDWWNAMCGCACKWGHSGYFSGKHYDSLSLYRHPRARWLAIKFWGNLFHAIPYIPRQTHTTKTGARLISQKYRYHLPTHCVQKKPGTTQSHGFVPENQDSNASKGWLMYLASVGKVSKPK